MDFGYGPEQEALRQEVRKFIDENVTPEVLAEVQTKAEGGEWPHFKEMHRKAAERGWVGMCWPKEYGGQDGSRMDQYIVEEEFVRVGIAMGGVGSGAPAILAAGSEEQKQHFIPGLINGDISFAMGFTEPQGGADLAGLQCRAVKDGDEYVINGQKMFTSAAHFATHIYLMCRTDPDAPRHRGISIFLVPMDTPGISVRPLWTIQNDPPAPPGTNCGASRTNETFFEDVRVPLSALLGDENRGWYVGAMGLNLDRVGASRLVRSINRDEDFINWAKEHDLDGHSVTDDPAVRDKLAEMWIEAQVCRLMTMRSMSIWEHGNDFTYEGSAEKVWAPEHGVRITEAISQILGPYAQLLSGSEDAIEDGLYAHNIMGAFQSGINHGSVQIMRDMVARRGLGMPRG
ncbi:MAG: acyl-CoA dehydrogenase family protein [Dehalococcoidia bacterium]|nr:acyl-CoA dehydrogenase family protein [Dehalococcoidia bacterium]MDP6226954.1 acyl-CoA dehydrogenase family protein [Dehalococcoidia bacterium]MDP7201262.1 acyl-CoA dehydrogenase family protein [Dehalococcoidia bacterium]MDP7509270.1 acyl-CoA dehydrogenase family protein [Dehalococcoidia bacterium]HJN87232.1 acyl-CoA dehydrogenase family protein [Dehalococcoidia bacterium]